MYSLYLDSANMELNVGLVKDNQLIDFIYYLANKKQSELMVVEIHNLLKRNNIDIKSLKEIVVTIGPGSYTGIRIALTIAKTLAFSLSIPLYSISTLLSQKIKGVKTISLINARSNRSYLAIYDEDNKTIIKDTIWTNEEVKDWINKNPDYVLSGDTSYLNLEGKQPNVLLGMLEARKNIKQSEDIFLLKPIYLKDLI
ncbi:MAG: tRNA (adenosine(37)-N6)-threonylcarbamoyltransferase complex dimerization subunit type 1 TsaB [Bacilli bacterium]|jgi:tRNA threonylcarbamoyl adenosine modification protein YeaZ|nr:tRNA (adenosine(37)-N6)-threonylcarbamoyltransferase complex dimerization subunit type 1 TsaB [Bacilli bacterium]